MTRTENNIYSALAEKEYIIEEAPDYGILKSLGIVKDATVHKKMTYKLGGPVLLKVASSEIAIGKDIAKQIKVRG